ncbi:MAG TPA: hypothetical protein VK151_05505 [Fluviicola sp.]|nr:hypothetical protein [Fluviicola sp.]
MIGVLEGAFFLVVLMLIVVIVLYAFYLKNLQDLLNEVSEQNRQVPASNVWLMFIPLFNIVYRFILYPKISESLRLEFEERESPRNGDYLKGLGLVLGILGVVNVIPIDALKSLTSLGILIIWIVFWVKTAEFKNQLRSMPKGDGIRLSSREDLLD